MEGMNYEAFWRFIKLLGDNDLLKHVELIGSWCEYIYAQSGYLEGFTAGLRTLDIDFLIKNKRRPSPGVSLASIAAAQGYTIDHDTLTDLTKIYTPDLLEIEFLIEQKGAGTQQVLETNIGVNAQALHHVALLKQFAVTIPLFGFDICLPEPEAYVIHKIIINGQRGKKSEKDRTSIENILPFVKQEKMAEIIDALPKKDRQIVVNYLENH